LDEQDHLTVSKQRRKRSSHHRLCIAAGHMRLNFREPRIVNIVKPQLEPGDAQFGDQIHTTDPSPMIATVSRLLSVTVFPPVELTSDRRDYPASATCSIKLGSLFLTLPTRLLTGQHVISSAG
jgi:hypothetical protein